ncbi:MAG: hypothetical protein PHW34_08360 [Hespellia sp.]|nr:hypothetical protein [Hespellia sp.]
MGGVIGIEQQTFSGTIASLQAETASISVNNSYEAEISGHSEVMLSYVECMNEIKTLLAAYKAFAEKDVERIHSAGLAMIEAEKNLVQ